MGERTDKIAGVHRDPSASTPTSDAGGVAPGGNADILALGFGTTVAMWAVGYVCRFPAADVPSWLLLVLLLGCLVGGGYVAGRWSARGWRGGFYAGLLAAILNLLVLGSLLGGSEPNQITPTALWWLPGSLLVSASLGGVGGLFGSRTTGTVPRSAPDWPAVFAQIAAAATFLLLVAGGIVTAQEAGLAVVDWPNSYGYNMFLYPLARMTGGIYYEHAHRLLGSLVGLTTLALVVHLWRTDRRPWLRRFALITLLVVILQGILGGLRVTGRFTLSTSPTDTAPSIGLAIVHGITGQVFFGMLVALAVFASRRWLATTAPPGRPTTATDRTLGKALSVLLVIQLVLGALQRHIAGGLFIHISLAAVVVMLTVAVGARSWGLYHDVPLLKRFGRTLTILIGIQLLLGVAALVAIGIGRSGEQPHAADVVLTTTHQSVGAILLACTVALTLWLHRLVAPERTA